ncbi:MAG: hypothetical protein H6603_11700 [Flavobacteriales bacterium]|nr:hypothetical protein [Flavobacteriales bacterium]
MPKAKETPTQKIKLLEKQHEDKKLKISMLNDMIDIADHEPGISVRKSTCPYSP